MPSGSRCRGRPKHQAVPDGRLAVDDGSLLCRALSSRSLRRKSTYLPWLGLRRRNRIWVSRVPVRTRIGKRARDDLDVERPVVAGIDVVEDLAPVGDDPGEEVEAAGRAFRVGRAGNALRQVQVLLQRDDVDAAALEDGAVLEVDLHIGEVAKLLGDGLVASRQHARAHAIGVGAEAEVEARRLELVGSISAVASTIFRRMSAMIRCRGRSPTCVPMSAVACKAVSADPRLSLGPSARANVGTIWCTLTISANRKRGFLLLTRPECRLRRMQPDPWTP